MENNTLQEINNDEIPFKIVHTSEKIINKIKQGESEFILNGLCTNKNNEIYLDYIFFKHFASVSTYSIILNIIINKINNILKSHNTFTVHANLKNLSISDVDKHKTFIGGLSSILKEKYPNKLHKCIIYNSPLIFSQIYGIISLFIDKETQTKIVLYK